MTPTDFTKTSPQSSDPAPSNPTTVSSDAGAATSSAAATAPETPPTPSNLGEAAAAPTPEVGNAEVAHNEPVPIMTAEENAALATGAGPETPEAPEASVTEEPAPEQGVFLEVQHEGEVDVLKLELRADTRQTLKHLVYDAISAHHPNPQSFIGQAIMTLEGKILDEALTLLENNISKGHTIKIIGLPKPE